jgi:acetyl esterase/lipase
LGWLGALLGLFTRDGFASLLGLLGVAVSVEHIRKTTAPHDGFARAFGPDWQARIPPQQRGRMLPARYLPRAPEPPAANLEQDVAVGTHHETGNQLLADLWQPPAGVPHSGLGVIYLHGSGWHILDKDVGTRFFFQHLAGQGHVILDLAYTLAPKAGLHAMVADVKRAIVWQKSHAAVYGVDPERIVLMGGSAGGHLALLAAYTPNHAELDPADVQTDTTVRGVISYYGVVDLAANQRYFDENYGDIFADSPEMEQRYRDGFAWLAENTRYVPEYGRAITPAEMISGLLGGSPDDLPELYALASPINHVGEQCPPTLLLQGLADMGGMAPDVARLHRALGKAGVPSVLVEFPNTGHGFDLIFPRWSPAAQAALHDVERFLALMT